MTASPTPTAAVPGDVGLPSEEEIVNEVERELMAWRGANGGVFTLRAAAVAIAQKIPALIRPAFEALAEQAHYATGVAELAMQHRDAAEAKLAQAVEALEHFADEKNGVMQDLLWGDEPDTATGTITTRLGHIRAARSVVRDFRRARSAARGETSALASGNEQSDV